MPPGASAVRTWPDRDPAVPLPPGSARPRDPAAGPARPRRADRRAALHPHRHRGRRSPRHRPARGPGHRQQHPADRVLAVHLPGLRDHGIGGAPARRRRRAAGRAPGGAGDVAGLRRRTGPARAGSDLRGPPGRAAGCDRGGARLRTGVPADQPDRRAGHADRAGRYRLPPWAAGHDHPARGGARVGGRQPRAGALADLRPRLRDRRIGVGHGGRPVRGGRRLPGVGRPRRPPAPGAARTARRDAPEVGGGRRGPVRADGRAAGLVPGGDGGGRPHRDGRPRRSPDRVRDLELPGPQPSTRWRSPVRR